MGAAGAAGAIAASKVWRPELSFAEGDDPKEIPGTFMGIPGGPHVQLPQPGNEPNTIGDFDGVIAIAHIFGTGAASGGAPAKMNFEVDMRFMSGRYVGADGVTHQGTFGFI
jgi:hypothetical protein